MKLIVSYKQILQVAWQTTKHYKILWFYGIFASFISLEAAYEIILSQINLFNLSSQLQTNFYDIAQNKYSLINSFFYYLSLAGSDFSKLMVFVLVIAVILFFIWLVFISQIFIIKKASLIYKNKNKSNNSLIFNSFADFWPVFGANILTKLVTYAGYLLISLPLLYALLTKNNTLIFLTNFIFLALFTIFSVIISFLSAYTIIYIVIDQVSFIDAVKKAWYLFKNNITLTLEIAFILFVVKIISLILIFCLFLIVFIPLFLLFTYAVSINSVLGVTFSIFLIILFFTAISIFINSLFSVFYLSSWTITFSQLTEKKLSSKIYHLIINKLPSLFKKADTKELANKIQKKAVWINQKIEAEYKVLQPIIKKNYIKYKPAVKKQTAKFAKTAKEQYIKYKPVVKKQAAKTSRVLKAKYTELEPIIEKEIRTLVEQARHEIKTKVKIKKKPKQIKKPAKKKTTKQVKTLPKASSSKQSKKKTAKKPRVSKKKTRRKTK